MASMAMADTTLDEYRDIVITAKAPAAVRKAATDLQYHLQKIAGRPFPLVEKSKAAPDGQHFFVGSGVVLEQDEAISNLPREGWIIRSVPNGLLLAGDEKGTGSFHFIHAVSLFLERHCGVKWVWPGESGEIIPQNPTLKIPTLDESGAPEVKRRRLDMSYATYWSKVVY